MQPSMGFGQSIKNVMCSNYANCNGRACRSEFWYFFLFVFLVMFSVMSIALIIMANIPKSKNDILLYLAISEVILLIVSLIFISPLISVTVRRFHDIGKSGYFILLHFIPYAGPFIVLYFMAKDSDPSTNEYGFSPKYAVSNNNQTQNFIAQNGPIYPQNPTPNDAYPQAPYTNPVQQDPNQNLIYQQPYQNPIPQPYTNPIPQDPNQNFIYQQPYQNTTPQSPY